MKIQNQPDVQCPRGCGLMRGHGCTGTQDLYHCEGCGKMEWMTWQERRGSARKKATDDPIEVVACSGFINTCPGCEEGGYFADDPEACVSCDNGWFKIERDDE